MSGIPVLFLAAASLIVFKLVAAFVESILAFHRNQLSESMALCATFLLDHPSTKRREYLPGICRSIWIQSIGNLSSVLFYSQQAGTSMRLEPAQNLCEPAAKTIQ